MFNKNLFKKFLQKGGEEKMKKIAILLVMFIAITSLCVSTVYAITPKTLTVKATIESIAPSMDIVVLKFNKAVPSGANPYDHDIGAPSATRPLDMGTMRHTLDDGQDAGVWFGKYNYMIHIFLSPFGKKYDIKVSNFTPLTGVTTGKVLPIGAFGGGVANRPEDKYCWGDPQVCSDPQGDDSNPGHSSGFDTDGAVKTGGKIVYSSGTGTKPRIIQLWLGIPPFKDGGGNPFPGYVPLKLTETDKYPPDTYSGSMTLDLVTR